MNLKLKYLSSLIIFFFAWSLTFSQKATSEEDVKENAQKLFSIPDYAAALPLYSQLLSLYPKDPNYSYRFGACKLFAEKDKEAPLTYLEFGAAIPGAEPEAFFFLAKGYHLNYRFGEALVNYKKFEETGDEKSKEKLLLKRHIAMCENGQKLLKNVTDIIVLDKKKLNISDFFRNYDLTEFGGKIIKTPDEFKMPYDIKKNKESIMYLQPNAETIYFSSYGEDGSNGKDIYFSRKTPDGQWGTPQPLSGPVNTEFDEDYAFFHPNGTLYFASDGHNSMGGYDVFKTTFDEATQQWSYPVNIDFAVNTPGDDYLYITDLEEKNAYFSSNRESSDKEVTVYRVKVERIPVDIAIIKGTFIADATRSAKITIEDMKDGKIAGVFSTNVNSGDYVLTVPNGGKFKFIVETPETQVTYTGLVDIPRQKTLKTLKQEMQLMADNGEKRLIIKNKFDEEATEDVSVLLAEIFKEKAALEVNADEIIEDSLARENIVSVEKQTEHTVDSVDYNASAAVANTEVKSENISNNEIIKIAKEDAKNIQKEASDLVVEKEIAYSIANEKNRMSNDKASESENFAAKAANSNEPLQKQEYLEKVKQSKKESKLYAEQAVAAYNLAKEIEITSDEKQKEADIAFNYAQELENVVHQNSPEATAEKLAQLNQFQEKQKSQPQEKNSIAEIQKQIDEKRKETEIQTKLAQKLEDDVNVLQSDIQTLQSAARAEKKKKDKERLEEQASILERDLPAMQSEAFTAKEFAEKSQKELQQLEKQESILSSVVSEMKASDKNSITSLNEGDKSKLETEISTVDERIAKFEQELDADTIESKSEPLASVIKKEEPLDVSTVASSDSAEQVSPNYDAVYEKKIANDDMQTDVLLKEESKAKNYENWAKAIEEDAELVKQKAESATDESEKALLIEKATALESSAREKRKLALENTAMAEQIKSSQSSTEAKNENPEVPEDYENFFKQKIESNEAQPDIVKKEESKARDLEAWAKTIEKEAAVLKQKADTTTDEAEKAALNEKALNLDRSAKEKLEQSRESQATAAQLRLSTSPTAENSFSSNNSIASYSEKYISTEQKAMGIQNEKDKAITLAEINKEWANDISKEIATLHSSEDTIMDGNNKAERKETIRLLEELKIEKERKSQQYTEKALESNSVSPVLVDQTNIPPDYTPWFEEKILEQENLSSPVQKEEAKAAYYTAWANATDNEIQQLRSQSYTVSNEEEKRGFEEKIAKLEMQSKEKRDLSAQSTEQARQLNSASGETATVNNSSSQKDINFFELPPDAQLAATRIEAAKVREMVMGEKKYQLESYNNILKAIDLSMENSKSIRQIGEMETQKRDLQARIEALNIEIEKEQEAAVAEPEETLPLKKMSEEKTVQSQVSVREADSLQSEVLLMNYQAGKMGIFKRKKKEELLAKAKTTENEAQMKRLDADLATQSALSFDNGKEESINAYKNNSPLPSETEAKKSKTAEEEAAYLTDQASAVRQSILIVKKKKEKKRLLAQADSLDHAAAMKKKEAQHNAILAAEMKKIEKEAFVELIDEIEKTDSPLPFSDYGFSEEEALTFKENSDQQNFSDSRRAYKKLYLEAEVTREGASKMKKEADSRLNQFATMVAGIDTIADVNSRNQVLWDAMDFLDQTKRDISKSDSIGYVALVKEETAREKVRTAILPLLEGDNEIMKKIFSYQYYKPPVDSSKLLASLDSIAAIDSLPKDTIPEIITPVIEETFTLSADAPVYDDKNPIPLNPKYPDGLIWQVQIGAFRNPIPQDLFKGFAPVMGVKVSDGITRYSAGMFKSFTSANSARNEIAKLGYKDAFVVAYKDGMRISITEARRMIAQGLFPSENITDISVTPEKTIASSANLQTGPGENPVSKIEGLFYTVQVGVYSKPASSKQLFNVQPLNSENLPNGTIRYSSGVYKDFGLANEAKNKIVDKGIKDAFVCAYHSGKRISIAEANRLNGNAGQPLARAKKDISSLPGNDAGSGNSGSEEGVVFRVHLGSFSGEIPVEQAGAILEMTRNNTTQKLDENGNTIYFAGIFKEFASAEKLKIKAIGSGLTSALVVAFNNGSPIELEDAKKLVGNE